MDIETRQSIEISFWKNSNDESPQADSVYNLVNKMSEARVFLDCFHKNKPLFDKSSVILEVGGGQGWASGLVKKLLPGKTVIASDISEWAIASIPKWERIFAVNVDKSFACRSYEIPMPDASVDLIFVFAAAHHFAAHRRTLAELHRVLKSGGTCLYLHEPVCPKLFYKAAHWRVNRKRPEVPEDVLITRNLMKLAEKAGLTCQVTYNLTTVNRGAVETLYFFVQRKLPFLARWLPSTANFAFTKQRPREPTSGCDHPLMP